MDSYVIRNIIGSYFIWIDKCEQGGWSEWIQFAKTFDCISDGGFRE